MYLDPYPLLEQALLSNNPDEKGELTQALFTQLGEAGGLTVEASRPVDCRFADRPLRPQLIAPPEVVPCKTSTVGDYTAMLRTTVYIKFNAINLALGVAYRFHSMPFQFVCDWVRVTKEEVFHFGLVHGRLNSLGYNCGDFEAHGRLQDMAYKTAYDSLLRMALVPRVLEAHDLDVTPDVHAKVAQRDDIETCDVLDIIYRSEAGHVAVGSHWYQHLCRERSLGPVALFRSLIARYGMSIFRGYVNIGARERAGFNRFGLDMLEDFEKSLKQDKKAV